MFLKSVFHANSQIKTEKHSSYRMKSIFTLQATLENMDSHLHEHPNTREKS